MKMENQDFISSSFSFPNLVLFLSSTPPSSPSTFYIITQFLPTSARLLSFAKDAFPLLPSLNSLASFFSSHTFVCSHVGHCSLLFIQLSCFLTCTLKMKKKLFSEKYSHSFFHTDIILFLFLDTDAGKIHHSGKINMHEYAARNTLHLTIAEKKRVFYSSDLGKDYGSANKNLTKCKFRTVLRHLTSQFRSGIRQSGCKRCLTLLGGTSAPWTALSLAGSLYDALHSHQT